MLKRLGAAALALALAACGGSSTSGDPYAQATPDVAGLALETSGGTADGLAALTGGPLGSSASALTAATAAAPACQDWQYLCRIRQGVKGLNQYVRAVVEPVEALAATAPSSVTADTKVYGPVDAPAASPVATFRLTVKQDAVDADTFRWKLEGKPLLAADGAYVVVLAGKLKKGDLPHRGRGVLAIDLTRLSALNTSGTPVDGFKGAGQIFAAFAHVGQAKSLVYVVRGFVPDTTAVPAPAPLDAAFVGHKTPSGETRVRLASVDEYVAAKAPAADSGPELLLSRARWVPGLGGRAAVVVTDTPGTSDVASYGADFFLGVSCFDRLESEGYHKLFACSRLPAACVDVTPATWPASDLGACLPDTELADQSSPPPATGQGDTTPEPGAPATPDAAPSGMAEVTF